MQNAVFAVRLEGAVFGKHLYFPKMSVKNYQRIMNMVSNQISDAGEYGQMKLLHKYCTQDSEEEAACDYLDEHKGCILSQEDKPFDCKIWPLRIMRKGDRLVIALTPTCPSIGREPSEELKELVNNGLGEVIYNYAKENPFIIKEYKEGFPIIMG